MNQLYCGDCGNYLMGGDGECHNCPCGWKQPVGSAEKEYIVTRSWNGYSRGYETRKVWAKSEEEAKDNFWGGEELSFDVVRDDTETTDWDAEEV